MVPGLRYCPSSKLSPWPARASGQPQLICPSTPPSVWMAVLSIQPCPCLPAPSRWASSPLPGGALWGPGEAQATGWRVSAVSFRTLVSCRCASSNGLPAESCPWSLDLRWWPYKHATRNTGVACGSCKSPVLQNHASTLKSPREGPKHRLFLPGREPP